MHDNNLNIYPQKSKTLLEKKTPKTHKNNNPLMKKERNNTSSRYSKQTKTASDEQDNAGK